MAKKRKSDATRLDEVDRGIYTAFCSAANNLSQLYSQAMNQQRLSFQAGERHAMEKLYSWILRQQEDGVRVTPGDIVAYVQNELDCAIEEQQQQQPTQNPTQSTHAIALPMILHIRSKSAFWDLRSTVGGGVDCGILGKQCGNLWVFGEL
ncbi:Uncharacterised conserved protein UCP009193 [Striga hermonthica]|uniref:Uncharacterized conserved protein UCP009193 n=1 Tax=Striga hermonthica TaxID=68872 RepID=A0A9N7NNA0_STRHE|nr:Uncharacterised conserved protein UCP009193 [Striga hermonthica]